MFEQQSIKVTALFELLNKFMLLPIGMGEREMAFMYSNSTSYICEKQQEKDREKILQIVAVHTRMKRYTKH